MQNKVKGVFEQLEEMGTQIVASQASLHSHKREHTVKKFV
jgi:hypothetical protein